MAYINADLVHPNARVSYGEVNFDLDAWLEEGDYDFPTAEMTQAERAAACYGQDNAALCIAEHDFTEDGTPIPPWAFE